MPNKFNKVNKPKIKKLNDLLTENRDAKKMTQVDWAGEI